MSQIALSVATPQLFAGLTLTAGSSSAQAAAVSAVTTFTFTPPVSIAANGSVQFTLRAKLQNASLAMASTRFVTAGIAVAGSVRSRGLIGLGLALTLIGACLETAGSRRVWLIGWLLVPLAIAEVGCGSSGNSNNNNTPLYGSSQMSVGKNAVSVTNSSSGGIVGVLGLPATVSTVTVN